MPDFKEDIHNSLQVLRNGGVILYPTDTIWGLGCDATNRLAVENIFRIKSREENKSLIILVNNMSMLERYVKSVPEVAYELTSAAVSPLTIVYPEGKNLAPGICNTDGSVGIRICNDEFCLALISGLRKPLVSTSANISGMKPPSNFSEIDPKIITMVDYTVKVRQDEKKEYFSSSVIKVEQNGVIKILRQ